MATSEQRQVHVDVTQIPEYVRFDLLHAAYHAVIEYFKQPGVEEKFQQWLAAREAARAAEQNQLGE